MSYDGERIPLHDARIEGAVLGSMILHARICDDCLGRLTSADFYRPAHQDVFKALGDLRARNLTPDPVVLSGHLDSVGKLRDIGGASVIDSMVANVGSVNNYLTWVEGVREKATLRMIQDAMDEAEATLHSGESASTVASLLSGRLTNVGGSLHGIVEAGDVLRRGPLPKNIGYATGIPLIDEETATKGAPRGQLCAALASSGVGKSTLLIELATHYAWNSLGVLYTTLADLNEEILVSRVIRMRCGYSSRDIADRKGFADEYDLAVYELSNQVSFAIDDRTKRGSMDVDDIIGTIEAQRHRLLGTSRPLKIAMLDYFQKLTSRHFKPSDTYAMSVYCSKRLSRYAEQSGVTLWVGSQITDGNEKAGTRDKAKGGNHLLEDAGLAVKVTAGTGNSRKFRLEKSRFGGQFEEADMVFNPDYLLFLPPGVNRPWL